MRTDEVRTARRMRNEITNFIFEYRGSECSSRQSSSQIDNTAKLESALENRGQKNEKSRVQNGGRVYSTFFLVSSYLCVARSHLRKT